MADNTENGEGRRQKKMPTTPRDLERAKSRLERRKARTEERLHEINADMQTLNEHGEKILAIHAEAQAKVEKLFKDAYKK